MYSFADLIRRMPPPTFSDTAITDRHSDTTFFSSSEHTGCRYPGLLDRKNRSDICCRWESNPRLPPWAAKTVSTRPGTPLSDLHFIVRCFYLIFWALFSRYSSQLGKWFSLTVHMTSQFVDLCNRESQAPIRHTLLSSDNSFCTYHVKLWFENSLIFSCHGILYLWGQAHSMSVRVCSFLFCQIVSQPYWLSEFVKSGEATLLSYILPYMYLSVGVHS